MEKLTTATWLNDRDQFLIPDGELPEEFKLDCLVWLLFHNSNLTASADGLEWNGRKWSIVNHFIPFTADKSHVAALGHTACDIPCQKRRLLRPEYHGSHVFR